MSETRRFLVALAGTEDPALAELVAAVVGAGGAGGAAAIPGTPAVELTLLHVQESGPRELAALQPAVRRGPWPLPRKPELEHRLAEADDEAAAAILAIWRERFAAALPGVHVEELVARGLPEREIVAAAARLTPDALILSPRPRTGPTEPGPRSVGHVARFVLDHSPVPVLLIRRKEA
jgi:nucleotide-binding universal stress UspA family protein